jgi:hypothetical protein
MFRDSLAEPDYSDYSFPNTPTAIVLEKSEDSDFVLPTVPSQKQLDSIHSGEIMPIQAATPPTKFVTFIPLKNSTKLPVRFESEAPEARPNSNLHWYKDERQIPAMAVPPPPPPSKLPFITTVYIGSLTVVGLFLLFRMIQK